MKLSSDRRVTGAWKGWALAVATAICATFPVFAVAQEITTVKPGVLTVVVYPFMPHISNDNGKLVGLDGDLLNDAAAKLGLTIEAQDADFAGALAAVQAGRADIVVGNVSWTAQRAEAGLFTDPPYYASTVLIQKPGANIEKVADLEGHAVGYLSGALQAKAVPTIPGATPRAYPTIDAGLLDVAAGRVAGFFTQPLVAAYAVQANPRLGNELRPVTLAPPTAAELEKYPDWQLFNPFQGGWYTSKNSQALVDKLNEIIRTYYESGFAAETVKKWGGDPELFLKPVLPLFEDQRHGVDRPDDWKAPSIE